MNPFNHYGSWLMPSHNTLTQSFLNYSFPMLSDILDQNLCLLDSVSTNTDPGSISTASSRTLFVEAEGNTWCRSAWHNCLSHWIESLTQPSWSWANVWQCDITWCWQTHQIFSAGFYWKEGFLYKVMPEIGGFWIVLPLTQTLTSVLTS